MRELTIGRGPRWNDATGSAADFVFSGDISHILDGLLSTGPIVDGDWVISEPQGALASGTTGAAHDSDLAGN